MTVPSSEEFYMLTSVIFLKKKH